MEVKREGETITIKMGSEGLAEELQRTLDYARVLELTRAMKKLPQKDVDALADDIKRNWWNENKSRFLQ